MINVYVSAENKYMLMIASDDRADKHTSIETAKNNLCHDWTIAV